MNFPSYERQNKWLQDYIAPLFDLNLAKIARNYRMNSAKPFTDERMQQIREDVLTDIREKIESNQKADPLRTSRSDFTYKKDGEKIRKVDISTYGGGLSLAPLRVEYVSKDPEASIDAQIIRAMLMQPDSRYIKRILLPYTQETPLIGGGESGRPGIGN